MICTRSRCNLQIRASSSSYSNEKRLHSLKGDIKSLVDQRFATLIAVDTVIRDMAQKDLELRKEIVKKWIDIAKKDCEYAKQHYNGKNPTNEFTRAEETKNANNNTNSVNDANAFYDPWVGE